MYRNKFQKHLEGWRKEGGVYTYQATLHVHVQEVEKGFEKERKKM